MNHSTDGAVSFREAQQFRQVWMWAIMLPVSLFIVILFGSGMIRQLVLGQTWGDRPLPDVALAIFGSLFILLAVGFTYLLYVVKMVTEVRDDGVYMRFFPFARREIPFGDITGCEARTYSPIKEYGGWGIRYGRGGKAYNVSGNRGVQLVLSNGKRLLIGSRRADELAMTIEARIHRRER